MREKMWVEKYRPDSLEDMVNQKEAVNVLQGFLESPHQIPHLLFAGPPGTGKTTAALCIAKEVYGDRWPEHTLELNASDERGIDTVRNRVKNFSRYFDRSQDIPFKFVILDEADNMTSDAQTALRRIMEKASGHTRFALICNYPSRIISPIQSRCATLRFGNLPQDEFTSHLDAVCSEAGVTCTEESLSEIYKATRGDMRRGINLLQSAVDSDKSVTKESVTEIAGDQDALSLSEVVDHITQGDFAEARKSLFDRMTRLGLSGQDIVRGLMSVVDGRGLLKSSIAAIIAEYDYRILEGANENIQISALLAELTEALADDRDD